MSVPGIPMPYADFLDAAFPGKNPILSRNSSDESAIDDKLFTNRFGDGDQSAWQGELTARRGPAKSGIGRGSSTGA